MAAPLRCCALLLLTLVSVATTGKGAGLQRHKREWITYPRRLEENHDYTGLEFIAKIRSDKENFTKITYSLSGPGVDQVFRVDAATGFVRVFTILDREKVASYHLIGVAQFLNGSKAERDIDLIITVDDVNDCTPVILTQQVGSVSEGSAADTVVMRVMATDADQPNTLHSKISFSIVESSNAGGMFYINAQTGEVRVRRSTLDRETKDTYSLMIQASDMNGAAGGNTGTGEIQIKLLDINDNIPTLEREWYEGSVQENKVNVEVLRIQALDLDLKYSDNWLAVFEIVSGNEGGYFTITTDAKTNEGVIMVTKALDYENIKVLNLGVAVSNKAAYYFGSGASGTVPSGKPYPIRINVLNQKEGPRFEPAVKVVNISESHTSVSIHQVITNYAAIDSDTLTTATNVRYTKIRDDDNWLIVDGATADIRLNKLPDRESKFLINGTYYAEIICITNDVPSFTATGTIAIQVEDFNDHCPQLTATRQTMCLPDNAIYVTAVDLDDFPNSAPFHFSVIQGSSEGRWLVEHLNETTAILRDQAGLWPGIYRVALEVRDQQGKSCADLQVVHLTVCTCVEATGACALRSTATAGLGAAAILLLLLGLLLLLLIPCLLLFCLCGGTAALADFKAIPFETKQQLISYHTEGQGEDKEVPLLHVPVEVDGGGAHAADVNKYGGPGYELGGARGAGGEGGGGGGGVDFTSTLTAENMHRYNQYRQFSGMEEVDMMGGGTMGRHDLASSRYQGGAFDGMALSSHFLEEYYSSKADHAAQQAQEKDGFLRYDLEGGGSPAGSVGCCSLLDADGDLAFLDDLGPKFKTLADICRGTAQETVDTVDASVPPVRPATPVGPSAHVHVHTHGETLRDRDVALGLASGSSTFVQEEKLVERVQTSVPSVPSVPVSVIPSQTVLIQQPAMYYAAAPMYVVESKPQVMLVAGGAQQAVGQVGQVGQVGLSHGLVQVSAQQTVGQIGQIGQVGQVGQVGQGLVQVGALQGSQGVVLVDRQVGVGGASGHPKQVLLVEEASSSSSSSAAAAAQEVRGQGARLQAQSFSVSSAGSQEEFAAAAPRAQAGQRVVVQHKKVSVTERNVESSSRA